MQKYPAARQQGREGLRKKTMLSIKHDPVSHTVGGM